MVCLRTPDIGFPVVVGIAVQTVEIACPVALNSWTFLASSRTATIASRGENVADYGMINFLRVIEL
jgi:hypothetical protein